MIPSTPTYCRPVGDVGGPLPILNLQKTYSVQKKTFCFVFHTKIDILFSVLYLGPRFMKHRKNTIFNLRRKKAIM